MGNKGLNLETDIGQDGASKGFYEGFAGKGIAEAVQKHGGTMTVEDLKNQMCSFPDPTLAQYRDVKLWQVPPNGQGVVGLSALKGLQHLEQKGACPKMSSENIGTADYCHAMIKMMRLGFHDVRSHVTCKDHIPVTVDWLLNSERIAQQAEAIFDPKQAKVAGKPLPSSCTVSFQVVDKEGNAISFVNSNFMGFGTGIVPDGCGFTLQDCGSGFAVEPGHPNVAAPRK
jgi:gamma-glutamyltranspeptidase/glutathione hydrolase